MKTTILELMKSEPIIILIMAPFVIMAALYIVRWGIKNLKKERENERKYEDLYTYISLWIDSPIDKHYGRDHIEEKITELESMPFKNEEKTSVLINRFLIKFKTQKEPELVEQ